MKQKNKCRNGIHFRPCVGGFHIRPEQGITLIALIITIIVMLILVAVTVNVSLNGGLFDYAGRAARETNTKMEEEKEWATLDDDMTVDELIKKYTMDSEGKEVTHTQEQLEKMSKGIVWDISATTNDNVKAYPVLNDDETYTLYVAGEGKMTESFFDSNSECSGAEWFKNSSGKYGYDEDDIYDYTITSVIVQKGVKNIGDYFFGNSMGVQYTYLKKVTIADSVSTIGADAFGCCISLNNVKLSNGLTSIGVGAFSHTALTIIVLPNTLTEVLLSDFYGSPVEKITFKHTEADSLSILYTSLPNLKIVEHYGNSSVADCNWDSDITVVDLSKTNK